MNSTKTNATNAAHETDREAHHRDGETDDEAGHEQRRASTRTPGSRVERTWGPVRALPRSGEGFAVPLRTVAPIHHRTPIDVPQRAAPGSSGPHCCAPRLTVVQPGRRLTAWPGRDRSRPTERSPAHARSTRSRRVVRPTSPGRSVAIDRSSNVSWRRSACPGSIRRAPGSLNSWRRIDRVEQPGRQASP